MVKFIFALFLFISIVGHTQSKDERVIRAMLDKQTNAWNEGKINDFMIGYWNHDSLMFIGKSGITYGWENTLANYKKGYPDITAMGTLTFNLIKVEKLSRKYYHVVGKWSLKRTIGDLSGHYTLLIKKIRGKWVIVSDHSS